MSDEQIIKMLELRAAGKTETEIAEALGISAPELRALKTRHQVAVGKAVREHAAKLSEEGKSPREIAAELGITEDFAGRLLQPPGTLSEQAGIEFEIIEVPEIVAEQTIWYPGPDYIGREGDYAKEVLDVTDDTLIELVQKRAQEDGEWAIEQGRVGGRPEFMRKMIEWVSDPKNIRQCSAANLDKAPTVDWICRELANVTKHLGGSRG